MTETILFGKLNIGAYLLFGTSELVLIWNRRNLPEVDLNDA